MRITIFNIILINSFFREPEWCASSALSPLFTSFVFAPESYPYFIGVFLLVVNS